MIRAIYRWQVKPGYEDVFTKAWVQGTKAIRTTVRGARGSVLLRNHKNPSAFMAVARWDNFEDWWAFRQGEPPDPQAFRIAAAVSDLYSVEASYEVHDLRVPQVPDAREWMKVASPFVTEASAA